MKFKAFIIAASLAFACNAQAQDINSIPNLDLEEDTTGVASVNDIVKMQQEVLKYLKMGMGGAFKDAIGIHAEPFPAT